MKGSNAPQARPTSTEKIRSPRDPVAPGTTPDKPTTPVSHMNRKPVISSISEQGRGDRRSLERKPLQNHLFSRDWFRSDREQLLQHRRKVATFFENCWELEGKSWIFERIPRSNSNTRETDDFSSEIKAKSCFPHRIGRFAGDLTLQNWPIPKENQHFTEISSNPEQNGRKSSSFNGKSLLFIAPVKTQANPLADT